MVSDPSGLSVHMSAEILSPVSDASNPPGFVPTWFETRLVSNLLGLSVHMSLDV